VVARGTSRFEVIPAIDLRGGRVVRLRQGDFAQQEVFSDDPASVADTFVTAGARWIHVVDLDGAREGARLQAGSIAEIVDRVADRARIEVAGGLRDEASVGVVVSRGAARVVIGTAALEDATFVARLIEAHGPDRVAVALDIRDGVAVGHGWVPGAPGVLWQDAAVRLAGAGVRTFIVTAIERDGLLGGPDLELVGQVIAATEADVIASGGIGSIGDLEACRDRGAAGAIVGRAIYTGALDLGEAIRVLREGG
jgi:phosphoribosylformimino-5-aminoimidazole carboxamide ribotide isomerase